ncbi:MAG: dTDP-4-dehydrorhamnose reductase [Microbacteriaceae bacterium]
MRYLVVGARGMLGMDMVEALHGRTVLPLGRTDLDVRDAEAVNAAVRPGDVVINCAAYNQVDAAETDEEAARAVNEHGVRNLAIACRVQGAQLITVSTDYVFDGNATSPYPESEPKNPVSAYGRSKAAGEDAALAEHPSGSYIVRTAWLYGQHGNNFAQIMLNLARTKDRWPVVDDQHGQPTWTRDLAAQIVRLNDAAAPAGIYHGTNSGETSWFGFAQAVLTEAELDPSRITPAESDQFVRAAARPAYSVLGHERWEAVGIPPMRSWRAALHDAVQSEVFEI